ncbi:MAG: hypothetical protein Q4A34_02095 [Candidatus Saccharibacteria bacterium]|nr:hypothetical protein [Candidatus Saccharibacteria bacterium]
MMKRNVLAFLAPALRDRWFVGLMIANGIAALVIIGGLFIFIEPKETQVITHYTIFGTTNYYRGYWYSLWLYGVLAVIMVAGHLLLAAKLYQSHSREASLGLLWLGIGMLGLLWLMAMPVINIAALG